MTGTRPADDGLVGRDAERAAIAGFVAPDRALPVLALTGEAGIGKTRLAALAVGLARARGMTVLEGRPSAGVGALPLGVMRDALRRARRAQMPLDGTGDALADAFPRWLLPELASGGPPDTVERDVLLEAAVRFVCAHATGRGLLLMLEDLHLATESTCAMVEHLAGAVAGHDVALLLTFRDERVAPLTALRRALRRDGVVAETVLTPLADDAVALLIARALGTAPAPEVVAAVARVTAGNPFAVEEVVRAAVDRGRLDPSTGHWTSGDRRVPLPWTVRDMLVSRTRGLPEGDQEVLRLAAVIGEQIPVPLLSHASGRPPAALLATLGRLRERGMLANAAGDAVAFRHALAREAVLADMLSAERASLHRRVLEALEDGTGDVDEAGLEVVLVHALGSGEHSRAVGYSLRAARRARALGGLEEAAAHLERASAMWSPAMGTGLHAELLLERGRVLAAGGDRPRALEVLREARRQALRAGRPGVAGAALACAAEARLDHNEREGVIADLRRACEEVAGEGDELRAEVLAVLARADLVTADPEAARRRAVEGLALAPASMATVLSLRITLGAAMANCGEAMTGVAMLEEARRAAGDRGDAAMELRALLKLAACHADRLEEAARHADAAVALARSHGRPAPLLGALWRRAAIHVEAGEWDAADARAEEAEALLGDVDDPVALMGLMVVRGMRARRSGRVDEATDLFTAVRDEAARRGIPERELESCVGIARTRSSAGDPAAAWEALEPAVARWGDVVGAPSPAVVALLVTAVELCLVRGDTARAVALAARLARTAPGPRADYAVALAAGADGRPGAAETVSRTADIVLSMGRRPEAARMLMVAAEVLSRAPGDPGPAADLAERARGLYRAMGSDEWGRRADGLLRRLGRPAASRAGRADGPDGLTPREREVLGLIAEGLSNRAIAERLVISEATAARHVFNMFTKLGVHTRAQAVAAVLAGGRPSAGGDA